MQDPGTGGERLDVAFFGLVFDDLRVLALALFEVELPATVDDTFALPQEADQIGGGFLFDAGELSVRGYANDSLGPVSTAGVPIGGEALLVVNQELRFPVWKSIRGLLFVDAGNIWRDGGDLDFAADLGLRVSTPVGLVRFDVAMPLDRRPQDDDVKLYLGLGSVS